MNILALIPARMGSSRFPGKPLARIMGKPMIGMVYDNVSQCSLLDQVAVATCDQEIYSYIESIDGTAIMTGTHHVRASDRCAEAVQHLEKMHSIQYDIVVMVQGDEPMTHPDMISEVLEPLINEPDVQVANLVGEIDGIAEFEDRNCIKVVCDRNSNALYLSREPIPTLNKTMNVPMLKQVCIIPFRRDFLLEYTEMDPTPLEISESIDMLRVLENGLNVRMVPTKHKTKAVDTVQDLVKVSRLIASIQLDLTDGASGL